MAANPVPFEDLPRAVAVLFDHDQENFRGIAAVERLVMAVAVEVALATDDPLAACERFRATALDPLALDAGARTALERALVKIETRVTRKA